MSIDLHYGKQFWVKTISPDMQHHHIENVIQDNLGEDVSTGVFLVCWRTSLFANGICTISGCYEDVVLQERSEISDKITGYTIN